MAGRADNPGQDRQFRRDLCRRLHASGKTYSISDYTDYADAYDALLRMLRRPGRLFLLSRTPPANDRPAPIHHRHGSFQEDEPGIPHRIAGGQAVPRHGRPVLSAPDERHSPGLSDRRPCRRTVGQRLAGNAVADPAEARRQGLCGVRRSELRRHAADHPDRRAGAVTNIDNTPDRLLRLRPESRHRPS